MSKKFQILVPCFNEGEAVVKPLLDSIQLQQSVNFDDIGVIIACDGGSTVISQELMDSYTFDVEFHALEHRGVSATRNALLDMATADYIMWADCDDMAFNMCGVWLVMREMAGDGFDVLVNDFIEETRHPVTKEVMYVNHPMNATFVHSQVFRRQYLIDNDIRSDEECYIHEDSRLVCLAQKCAKPDRIKYNPTTWWCWKWRDESVCRRSKTYILETYRDMLKSNTSLVNQFLKRGMQNEAMFYATSMIMDAYYSFNCSAWTDINNKEYRDATELRFKQYWNDFKYLFKAIPLEIKTQIVAGIRQRFFAEGLLLETQTFDQWISHIETL